MIPQAPSRPTPAWQRSLAAAVTSLDELLALLGLEREAVGASAAAAGDFALKVPRELVARMRPGDPRDPLLLQVLASASELASPAGWGDDPLAEAAASPAPGLLHKYRGRALVIASGACAVHCRYCFRRYFPYDEHRPWAGGWAEVLRALAADPSIVEVILSGGDPLTLSDDRLGDLVARLEGLPQLRRLRIHTRVPVVVPSRVDERLLAWLGACRLQKVVVVHVNHAREIDGAVARALGALRGAGAVLLNQSVLLAGVNDSVEALAELSEALFAAGALPYYLHLLDRVRGAAHFEVGEEEGRRLMGELSARLPGYLVPRLVREVPGEAAKVPIDLRLAPVADSERRSAG